MPSRYTTRLTRAGSSAASRVATPPDAECATSVARSTPSASMAARSVRREARHRVPGRRRGRLAVPARRQGDHAAVRGERRPQLAVHVRALPQAGKQDHRARRPRPTPARAAARRARRSQASVVPDGPCIASWRSVCETDPGSGTSSRYGRAPLAIGAGHAPTAPGRGRCASGGSVGGWSRIGQPRWDRGFAQGTPDVRPRTTHFTPTDSHPEHGASVVFVDADPDAPRTPGPPSRRVRRRPARRRRRGCPPSAGSGRSARPAR